MAFCSFFQNKYLSGPKKLEGKCKLHDKSYQFISLAKTNQSLSIQACKQCQRWRGDEEFISREDLVKRFQAKSSKVIAKQLLEKLQNIIKQTEESRKKLMVLVDQFYIKLKEEVQSLFVYSIIKQFPNDLFTVNDVFELISSKTVFDFENIIHSRFILKQVDETSAGLLAKVFCKEQQTQEFVNSIPKETEFIKEDLQRIYCDFEEMLNGLRRSVEQTRIFNTMEIPKEKLADRALSFMSPKDDKDPTQTIKKIKRSQAQLIEEQQGEENPQIKQIISIDEEFIAFCSGTKIFIIQTQNQQVKFIDCESDVTAICAMQIDNVSVLVSSIEESENFYQLIFWDWQNIEKIKVINAHQKYIWKIINLPENWIATCSDDKTIKIYDDKSIQEKTIIAVHDSCVNDIALINQDIIISVSDDLMVAASNFKTGEQKDIRGENCEIKCVMALDGVNFVTGNNHGEVRIYMFTNKIQLHILVKSHDSAVRFISRINSKMFVTSSWDGTNKFISFKGEILNQILEGPRKNFSEPILWANNCLWASISGKLYIY